MTCVEATLGFIVEDGEVILIYGAKPGTPRSGLWNGPGGKFEPEDGGNPEACFCRELLKETGLEPIGLRCHGYVIFRGQDPKGRTWMVYVFGASGATGELTSSAEGEVRRFPVEEVLDGTVATVPGTADILAWVVNRMRFASMMHMRPGQEPDIDVHFVD